MQARTFGAIAIVFVCVAPAPSCSSSGLEPYTFDASDDSSSDSGTSGTNPDGGGPGTPVGPSPESGSDDGGDDTSEDTGAAVEDTGALGGDSSTPDASPGTSDDAETGNPPPTGLSVLYQVQDPAATSAYIGCELSIVNSSTASPSLSDLTVRYYYTDEVHMTPQITINWSHVSTSGADQDLEVTPTVVALAPPVTDADTYVEFALASGSSPTLAPGDSAMFSWQLQGPNPAQDIYTQTNDYSFNASMTTLTAWDQVVLLEGGAVAWGLTP
jgi:hypothetical protein